ncbi:MAG: hypothetical protein HYU66_01715, partial [Armatimonadetes bacterium]|nr:hypothetical protein [Armatimonadota bacterium]
MSTSVDSSVPRNESRGMLPPGLAPGPAVARLTVYIRCITNTVIAERSHWYNGQAAWLEAHADQPEGELATPDALLEPLESPLDAAFALAAEVLSPADRHVLRARSYQQPLPYADLAKVLNAAPSLARRLGFKLPQTERALVERCRRARKVLQESAECLFRFADLPDPVGLGAALRERRHG